MRMNTDALVLKVTDTGESDRLVTLLTSEYGVLRAFANRAKKINSKTLGATQSLCYGDFSIYTGRDAYIIDDATAKEVFFGLREDIVKLSLAQYFCSVASELAPEMEPAGDLLRVILNSLHLLETGRRTPEFLKAVTEMKMMAVSGFMPEIENCPHCSKELSGEMYFSVPEGAVFCRSSGKNGERINSTVLDAMRFVCISPVERIYSFTLPAADQLVFGRICEKYLLAQTGRQFKTLDFYKTMAQE